MNLDQGPVVVIGLQQIYDKLVALESTVSQLVGQHDGTSRTVQDHEVRLRGLERNRWPIPAVTIFFSLGSLAVAVVALFVR